MLRQWIKPLAISFACALSVTSCGGSSINVSTATRQCANGYDPALPVNVNVKSFTVDNSNNNLGQTAFKQFFAGIQPSSTQSSGRSPTAQDQQAANDVGALSQQFANYKPDQNATDYENYTSVRNAPDFINDQIGTDNIGNFDAGRQHIVACINQQAAAGYDNNNVTLKDLSTGSNPNAADSQDQAWTFIVRWSYSPNPSGGQPNVSRVIEGLNTNTSIISIYDPQTFNDIGFNQPESVIYGYTIANYTTNAYPNAKAQLTLNLTKQYVGNSNQDEWELASESTDSSQTTTQQQTSTPPLPQSFMGDSNVRCVRMVMHYDINTVDVYWSDKSPTLNNSTNTGTGAYDGSCLTDSAPNHIVYDTDPNNYPTR